MIVMKQSKIVFYIEFNISNVQYPIKLLLSNSKIKISKYSMALALKNLFLYISIIYQFRSKYQLK